jgi:hypothetical protein
MEQGISNNAGLVTGALEGVKGQVDGVIDGIKSSINSLSNMTIRPPSVAPMPNIAPGVNVAPGGNGTGGATGGGDNRGSTYGIPYGMSDSAWFALSQRERDEYARIAGGGGASVRAENLLSPFESSIRSMVGRGFDHMRIFENVRATGYKGTYGDLFNFVNTLPTNRDANFADSIMAGTNPTHDYVPPPAKMTTNADQLFDAIFGVNQRHRVDFQEMFTPVVGAFEKIGQKAMELLTTDQLGANGLDAMFDTGSLIHAVAGLANLSSPNAQQVFGVGGVDGGTRMLKAIEELGNKLGGSGTTYHVNLTGSSATPQTVIEAIKLLDAVFA